ncbi:hypothetical protein QTP88_025046 [Uroleucon formosanum]
MEVEELACVAYLYSRVVRRRQKNRKFWVHPLLSDRSTKGLFNLFYNDLRKYEDKFFNYLRMSVNSFDELMEQLREDLTGQQTNMRECISPVEKLVVTLSGCSFTELHHEYRLGISTISGFVAQVCEAIWNRLKDEFMPQPSTQMWLEISNKFEKCANFPNCIGAVDGKHIRVIKPTDTGSLYFNYKHYFSIVLIGVCDSNYSFVAIDVGAYGKSSDSSIFKESMFYKKMMKNTLNIPDPKPISTLNAEPMPHVIVGDEAFGLSENIMRPYGGKNLTVTKKIFNYRLSRARRYIECTFGILSNKWRIFHRPLNVKLDLAQNIIKSCCILHNFVRARDGYRYDDTLTVQGLENIENTNMTRGSQTAQTVRDKYANYFVTDGEVEWQYSKI